MDKEKKIGIAGLAFFCSGVGLLIFLFYLGYLLFQDPALLSLGEMGMKYNLFFQNILYASMFFVVIVILGIVAGKMTSEGIKILEDKKISIKVNILGAVGGALMLLSIITPWVSFIFNLSLLDLFGIGDELFEGIFVFAWILILLMLIGGVKAVMRGIIGGVIGIIGVIIFMFAALALVEPQSFIDVFYVFRFLGIGFYLALVGAILALISQRVKIEKEWSI
jgi:hypothetical protein